VRALFLSLSYQFISNFPDNLGQSIVLLIPTHSAKLYVNFSCGRMNVNHGNQSLDPIPSSSIAVLLAGDFTHHPPAVSRHHILNPCQDLSCTILYSTPTNSCHIPFLASTTASGQEYNVLQKSPS